MYSRKGFTVYNTYDTRRHNELRLIRRFDQGEVCFSISFTNIEKRQANAMERGKMLFTLNKQLLALNSTDVGKAFKIRLFQYIYCE